MYPLATLHAFLSKLVPTTVDASADRDPHRSRRNRQPEFRVDGWYNFELETEHRLLRR